MSGFLNTLIVSNNPLSTLLNNGKTLLSLFGEFPVDKISQVYLAKHKSEKTYVNSLEVSCFSCSFSSGHQEESKSLTLSQLSLEREMSEVIKSNSLQIKTSSKNFFTRILRDVLYLPVAIYAAFKTRKFISKFGVERIFWVYSDFLSLHLYVYLLKRLANVRIDIFFTDDYLFKYTADSDSDVSVRGGYHRLLYFSTRKMANLFTKAFVISDKMATLYKRKLGLSCDILVNPSQVQCLDSCSAENSYELRYFGSLHSGRFSALLGVAEAVNEFNSKSPHVDLSITVFTASTLTHEQIELAHQYRIRISEPVTGDSYVEKVCTAFGLLLLESDQECHLKDTWLSCSTKVPEYLSSGRPIIVWGPLDNPSIQVVAETSSGIYLNPNSMLLSDLFDDEKVRYFTSNANSIYRTKFSYEVMREKVKK